MVYINTTFSNPREGDDEWVHKMIKDNSDRWVREAIAKYLPQETSTCEDEL